MEQIRNYVGALFSSLPKTKEIMEMKLNMLENLEDKYQELLLEGKSENEAVGIILSQIGTVEELKQELGIPLDVSESGKDQSGHKERLGFAEHQDSEYQDPAAKRKRAKYDAFSGALWIITVILYLIMGFQFQFWHPGWIVFVIAAVVQIVAEYQFKTHS